jgi:hypothetical protein
VGPTGPTGPGVNNLSTIVSGPNTSRYLDIANISIIFGTFVSNNLNGFNAIACNFTRPVSQIIFTTATATSVFPDTENPILVSSQTNSNGKIISCVMRVGSNSIGYNWCAFCLP